MSPTEPPSQRTDDVTAQLSTWVAGLKLSDVPAEVRQRAKYLLLDGLACGVVGAHVPWSQKAVEAMTIFEPGSGRSGGGAGGGVIWGHDVSVSPPTAALLNGSFIQANELDDVHPTAPMHSLSIVVPALMATVSSGSSSRSPAPYTGAEFLLALITGFEVGPRVGNALHGLSLLEAGWHSGVVFGHPAAAAAASKLFRLDRERTEWALGIASTQACGLMSAQYGGMVKRMQHGFAARSGLTGAMLAYGGYEGMTGVLERPYGGLLTMFSGHNHTTKHDAHSESTPLTDTDLLTVSEVTKDLGTKWQTSEIRIKTHACVGGAYGTVQAIEVLQQRHPEKLRPDNWGNIQHIRIEISSKLMGHCGWDPVRPISATGAQMSNRYIAAVQLVDAEVLLAQFQPDRLDRDDVWSLVGKSSCTHNTYFDLPYHGMGATVAISFSDGSPEIAATVEKPRGMDPPTTNEEILAKWRKLTGPLLDAKRQKAIEEAVFGIEDAVQDVSVLAGLLREPFRKDGRFASKL